MKLILCPHCQDVVRLKRGTSRCMCGKSWGRYVNDIDAEVNSEAIDEQPETEPVQESTIEESEDNRTVEPGDESPEQGQSSEKEQVNEPVQEESKVQE